MKRFCKAALLMTALVILAGCALFNSPPVADFTLSPTTGFAPLTVYVSSILSYDRDGQIVSWGWDFGDGTCDHEETASHQYVLPGTYTITLVVEDNRGDTGRCCRDVVVTEPAMSSPGASMWAFIEYVRGNWVYEADVDPELCQGPTVSYARMAGDCDDFAVMIAYYLQERWGYDTFVAFVDMVDGEDHWVAFVYASQSLEDHLTAQCGSYPYLTWMGQIYIPLDWDTCPTWMWVKEGPVKTYEWNEMVSTYRSFRPARTEPVLNPIQHPPNGPATVSNEGSP